MIVHGINFENTDFSSVYTGDIAEHLLKLAFPNEEIKETDKLFIETEECLFYLKCCAANEYNRDMFRILLRVLDKITEYEI